MKEELADLAQSLRRRAQLTPERFAARAATPSAPGVEAPASLGDKTRLDKLAAEIHACRKCPLGSARLRAVPGVGSPEAKVMFIGEGPGFEEDHKGEPFVGKSGQLLDKIMAAIGLSRRTVYIANIVKCHPMVNPQDPEARGNDRPPSPEEVAACRGYLEEQIRAIAPKVIVTLGAVPMKVLLGSPNESITRVRGRWRLYQPPEGGEPIKLLPTFHPAALLRNPDLKKDVWTDMKNLKKELEGAGDGNA